MYVIFIDESGYTPKAWFREETFHSQPFFVLAGIAFPADRLFEASNALRTEVGMVQIPNIDSMALGRGIEIKGRDIARGSGYWGKNEQHRNAVRDLYLNLPSRFGVIAFLSIVNKRTLAENYAIPKQPDKLALKYLLERLQWFLEMESNTGLLIYDQNKRIEDEQASFISNVAKAGSRVTYFSKLLGEHVEKSININRLIEFTVGKSEHSLGLQIADFYASHTSSYLMSGRPKESGWWNTIYSSLCKDPSTDSPIGCGYKEFPSL